MLKRTLLLAISGTFIYCIFAGSSYGPAAAYDGNLTGSTGGSKTCNTGSSCHGGSVSSTTSVTLTLCDSGTTTTRTTYVPNTWYTVRLSGTNSLSRSRFGFQVSCTNSSGGQAGRFRAVASYTDTIYNSSTSPIQVVEHSSPIAGSSGSYTTYFNWKSPASGTSTVGFYSILNAVNYNGSADTGDKYNYGSTLSISEATSTNISEFGKDYNIYTYPNPITTTVNLQIQHATNGVYTINVFDCSGKKLVGQEIAVNSNEHTTSFSADKWPAGMYLMLVEKNGACQTMRIIKQ